MSDLQTVAALLNRLGVWALPQALERERAAALTRDVCAATSVAAETYNRRGIDVDPELRCAHEHDLGSPVAREIADLIESHRPELERFFRIALGPAEVPSFVTYAPGDYFRAHVDRGPADRDNEARARVVSIVLFLNDDFDGGELVFYGLLGGDARVKSAGIPLAPSAGLAVAFRSETLHEVAVVTRGVRVVAVTWFQDASGVNRRRSPVRPAGFDEHAGENRQRPFPARSHPR
jgi:predicted 2-oxoglutarate/Fe(II)-dependent dioxygenase YbiX